MRATGRRFGPKSEQGRRRRVSHAGRRRHAPPFRAGAGGPCLRAPTDSGRRFHDGDDSVGEAVGERKASLASSVPVLVRRETPRWTAGATAGRHHRHSFARWPVATGPPFVAGGDDQGSCRNGTAPPGLPPVDVAARATAADLVPGPDSHGARRWPG